LKKRDIKIINFLYLSKKEYNKILEYRNQEYIREISVNSDLITEKEHNSYFKTLKKKDHSLAFLIRVNDEDYGVISLKKTTNDTYYVGDYLIKEESKFEGGGILNRICISYISSKLNIKYLKTKQYETNTRGNRCGGVKTINIIRNSDGFNEITSVIDDFYDKDVINSKARKLFEKLYVIKECQI